MTSEKKRKSIQARRERLKAAGLCITCSKPAVNKNHCEEHRLWRLKYQSAYYRKNPELQKQRGKAFYLRKRLKNPVICQVCQEPIDPRVEPHKRKYHTLCAKIALAVWKSCRKQSTTSEAHRRAVRKYQELHLALGLCIQCPRPAINDSTRCELHTGRGGRKIYGNSRSNQTNAEKQATGTESRS